MNTTKIQIIRIIYRGEGLKLTPRGQGILSYEFGVNYNSNDYPQSHLIFQTRRDSQRKMSQLPDTTFSPPKDRSMTGVLDSKLDMR